MQQLRTTNTTEGGDDIINLTDGDNTVLAGKGDDQVTTTAGDDDIIGDNGQIDYDANGDVILMQTTDVDVSTAGHDTLLAGDGFNRVLGGLGQDEIITGNGIDHIQSDNGEFQYLRNVLIRATSTSAGEGDDDQVNAGNGDAVVLLGDGTDTLNAGDGNKQVIGDHGEILWTDAGIVQQLRTTDITEGGDDIINLTDGDNTVLAGKGDDQVTTTAGDDDIIGDNGQIDYDANGDAILMQTTDVDVSTAGHDTLLAGDGFNRVLGGLGQDAITTGNGDATILGDNGELQYVDDIRVRMTSTSPTAGDDDVIIMGNGKSSVIAGDGNDQVTGGDGDKQVIGDHGEILWRANGVVEQARSTTPAVGGDDAIELGDGDNTVIAGQGDDRIDTGAGHDDIIGDNGQIDYDTNGDLTQMQTTDVDDSTTGDDVINSGAGNDRVLAGLDDDTVNTGAGDDLAFGDQGIITYAGNQFVQAITTDPTLGGNDQMDLGDGNDRAFGGGGDDQLNGEAGDDIIFGDFGVMGFDDLDQFFVDTSDLGLGGDDVIDGGEGLDRLLGGAGADLFTGLFFDDVILGNYGRITDVPALNGVVVSTVPSVLGLIGGSQEGLYTGRTILPELTWDPVTQVLSVFGTNAAGQGQSGLSFVPVSLSAEAAQLTESELLQFLQNLPTPQTGDDLVPDGDNNHESECVIPVDDNGNPVELPEGAVPCEEVDGGQNTAPMQHKGTLPSSGDDDTLMPAITSAAMLAAIRRQGWQVSQSNSRQQQMQQQWQRRAQTSLKDKSVLTWRDGKLSSDEQMH